MLARIGSDSQCCSESLGLKSFLWKSTSGTLRKRKRETLEDEEDLSEEDYQEAKKNDSIMPQALELPEDDTGLFVIYSPLQ